jgi:hypothetical protein
MIRGEEPPTPQQRTSPPVNGKEDPLSRVCICVYPRITYSLPSAQTKIDFIVS